MKTCPFCHKQVGKSHFCSSKRRRVEQDDNGDFLLSFAVGMATNNALLGGLVGGDFAGGILGDMANTSDSAGYDSAGYDSGGGDSGGGGADSSF